MPRRRTSAPYARFGLSDFSKGLVLERPPLLLRPDEAQAAENVRLTEGYIRRRSGWTETATMAVGLTTEPVRGVFGRYSATVADELIAVAGDKLITYSLAGWTVKATFPFAAPIYPTFAQALTNVYVAAESGGVAQQLRVYNGTTLTAVAGAPSGRIVLFHNFALWVSAGDGANHNRVQFSRQIPNQATWPANNYVDITPGDGDRITGLAPLRDAVVVLKERSIARISGYPPDDATAADSQSMQASTYIYEQPGCLAPRTVDANKLMVVYLNRQGVYGFDGLEAKELTKSIRPLFSELNEAEMKNAAGGFIDEDHYVVAVPTQNSSVPNLIVSIRLNPQLHITTWRGYPKTDLGDGWTSHDLEVHSVGRFTFDDGNTYPVLGLKGKVGKMDDAPTDGGQRIRWAYRTGVLPLGDSSVQKVIRRSWLSAAPGTGALSVTFLPDFATEGVSGFPLDPTTVTATGERAVTFRLPSAGKSRRWAVEFSGEGDGPNPQVHELELEYYSKYRG